MRRSVDRILTTHVGSLPRSEALIDLLFAREAGEPVDAEKLAEQTQRDVAELVAKQKEAGIDIVSDGEAGKTAFVRYIKDRLTGFSGASSTPAFADQEDFPRLRAPALHRPGPADAAEPRVRGPRAGA